MPLDPDLAEFLRAVPMVIPKPIDWVAFRAAGEAMAPMFQTPCTPIEVGSVENRTVTADTSPVHVRVYRPKRPTNTTLIYIHGGGFAAGSLDGVDHTVRYFCEKWPAVVVSCTYRLAPESRFPAAFEDALAAVKWALRSVSQLGGDANRVLIAGDSAGGNLVAAVTLALRHEGEKLPAIAGQLLLYPVLDLRPEASALPSRMIDGDPTLKRDLFAEMTTNYLDANQASDPRASPAACADLRGVPPTLTVVLEVDLLRDEGVIYSDRLREAGVRSELVTFNHLTHGFVHMRCVIPAAARAFDEVISRFRQLLKDT